MKLKRLLLYIIIFISFTLSIYPTKNNTFTSYIPKHQNETEAQQVIKQTLQLLQHPGGAKFNYSFHLAGFFNRQGTFLYKKDKSLSLNKKSMVWADGKTVWELNRNQRVVKIMNPKESRKGLKGIDEQFELLEVSYTPSMTIDGNYFKIYLKATSKNVDAKEAIIWINRKTYEPIKAKVKIAFFWGTINISNFETANYSDEMFTFPMKKFPDVKVIDKRKL